MEKGYVLDYYEKVCTFNVPYSHDYEISPFIKPETFKCIQLR